MHEHELDLGGQIRGRTPLRPTGQQPAQGVVPGPGAPLDAATVLRLQRAAGNRATAGVVEEERSPVHEVVGRGGGEPLGPEVRADMESRLGHDFSDVRVHTGPAAAASAKAVQAHAYTVGTDVVFGGSGFDPSSTAGRTTLAHELTHVVQQRSGPVDGTPTAGGISVSDPSDRFEQEATATAERAMRVEQPAAPPVSGSAPSVAAAQREADPEDVQEDELPVQEMSSQHEGVDGQEGLDDEI